MSHRASLLYQVFKYFIYGLLILNVYLFLQEDLLAARSTFEGGIPLESIIQVFSASIDTLAWVVLLLIFELETFILDDEKIKGTLKWSLQGLTFFCYIFIVYAFTGYYAEMEMITDYSQFAVNNVCDLADGTYDMIIYLDNYIPITADNCAQLAGQALYRITDTNLIGTDGPLTQTIQLAWVDVINSAVWILVVVMLQIDVLLQLRGALTAKLLRFNAYIKTVLYSILLGAAVFWWFYGDFLDFWDALLWIVAFVFIELNIFQWHQEVEEEKARA